MELGFEERKKEETDHVFAGDGVIMGLWWVGLYK